MATRDIVNRAKTKQVVMNLIRNIFKEERLR